MLTPEETQVFVLFNEKAKELAQSRFSKQLTGSGITIKGELGKQVITQRIGPDYEAIKSYVITYRNFSLDTDSISTRNVAKIYDNLDDQDDLKRKFVARRTEYNAFLDRPSMFTINGKTPTHRDIINTYLYGDVIHLEKHDEFKAWIDQNLMKEVIWNEIVYILATAGNFIFFFDVVNREYLQRQNF